MNDAQAIDVLRRWAVSHMKWARSIAQERGTRITPIKGGQKNLNEAVQIILTERDHTPRVRAQAAVNAIREGIGT